MKDTDSCATTGTAVITGAGGGIGSACVDHLQRAGWQVIGIDRQFGDSDNAARGATQQVVVDIADQAAFRDALQKLLANETVDCLVNCAGITDVVSFTDQDPAMWQQLLDVNYLAPLTACQTLLPAMIERRRGCIIQITSDSSRTGAGNEAVYAGSKSALVAFSKSLAQEVGRFNVRVNCVSPGVVLTPMSAPNQPLLEKFVKRIPLKRLGVADDIAGAVKFLASDEANYITGQVLSVGGGLTMAD